MPLLGETLLRGEFLASHSVPSEVSLILGQERSGSLDDGPRVFSLSFGTPRAIFLFQLKGRAPRMLLLHR